MQRVPSHQKLAASKPEQTPFPYQSGDMYAQNWDDPRTQMARVRRINPENEQKTVERGNPGIVKRGK